MPLGLFAKRNPRIVKAVVFHITVHGSVSCFLTRQEWFQTVVAYTPLGIASRAKNDVFCISMSVSVNTFYRSSAQQCWRAILIISFLSVCLSVCLSRSGIRICNVCCNQYSMLLLDCCSQQGIVRTRNATPPRTLLAEGSRDNPISFMCSCPPLPSRHCATVSCWDSTSDV